MKHFVILSQQRSGSHMLMNLLNAHPLVQCNGDLMTRDVKKHSEAWAYDMGFTHHSQFRHEVPNVVDKQPEVIGFPIKLKMNLHQTIRKRQGLKIIFLQRQNRLAVLLSRELARVLRPYPDDSETMAEFVRRHSSHPPIYIAPKVAQSFFEERAAQTEDVLRHLTGTDWLPVFYENLCTERDKTMRAVFEYLGVPIQETGLSQGWGSTKLNQRSLSASISNFAELKHYFADTRWAAFFDKG